MNKTGFITLHRQILDWEWSKNTNTFALFVHLLLAANYEEKTFEGRKIKRGQLVTSLPSLSTATGLSIQQTRTALSHLISTGEITDEANRRYRIITIVKYSDFQNVTDRSTGYQQTINRQSNRLSTDNLTGYQQQYNNITNNNKETNKQRNNKESGAFAPPTLDEVAAYCRERKNGIDAQHFLDYYEARGWILGNGRKVRDWKACLRTWEARDKKQAVIPAAKTSANNFTQREYDGDQEDLDAVLGYLEEVQR